MSFHILFMYVMDMRNCLYIAIIIIAYPLKHICHYPKTMGHANKRSNEKTKGQINNCFHHIFFSRAELDQVPCRGVCVKHIRLWRAFLLRQENPWAFLWGKKNPWVFLPFKENPGRLKNTQTPSWHVQVVSLQGKGAPSPACESIRRLWRSKVLLRFGSSYQDPPMLREVSSAVEVVCQDWVYLLHLEVDEP